MADPFDFGQSDPSEAGMLGQPVSFWQNIARFGGNLAASANARTPQGFLANGTGLAGPLGQAITSTMDQGRQNAVTRADLAAKGATTQGTQIDNLLKGLGIPAAQAQANIRQRALTEPGFLQNFIQQLQGGGAPPNASGPASNVGPQSENAVPPDQRGPLVAMATQGTPIPPAVLYGLHDYETGGKWDPGAQNKDTGAWGLQQSLPSTAANPGYGVPPIATSATPQQQSAWAARYLAGRGAAAGVKDWSDPGQVTQALIAYHGPQKDANGIDGQMYAQQVLRRATQYGGGGQRAQVPGSFQVAQAGGSMPIPQQPQPLAPGNYTPDQAAQMGRQFIQQADQLDQQANSMQMGSGLTGLPMGDPAAMRTRAQQTRALGQQLLGAGPMEAAKAGSANIDARPGATIRFMGPNGPQWYKSPVIENTQSTTTGEMNPMHVTPPLPGEPEGTPGTATPIVGPNGLPITTKLGPAQQGAFANIPEIAKNFIEHDNKVVDQDLGHVISNTIQGKTNMMELRDRIGPSKTGFAPELRQGIKSALQTFSPMLAEAFDLNASPGQELKKIATIGAGKQENEDHGAARGVQMMKMYVEAHPNMENQPDANMHMANMIIVAHQIHEDYAVGATDFFNKQMDGVQNSQNPQPYKRLGVYDQQFVQKFRPEIFKSATDALNGAPYAEWSKGLTGPQMQIVGGVLQRADPNAKVYVGNQILPVSAFKTTIGPTEITNGR